MEEKEKRIVRVAVLAAGILALLALALSIQESIYEETTFEAVAMDEQIDGYALAFCVLDQYLTAAYPEFCADKALFGATANLELENDAVVGGEIVLKYYRYIDDSRKGGNIDEVDFYINPMTQRIVERIHVRGSGTPSHLGSDPLTGSAWTAPLQEYVQRATALCGPNRGAAVRLLAVCNMDCMTVEYFTPSYDRVMGPLYGERLLRWRPNELFQTREFEPID